MFPPFVSNVKSEGIGCPFAITALLVTSANSLAPALLLDPL